MKKLVIIAVGIYSLLMAASLVFAQAGLGKLTVQKCSGCHDTARICGNLGTRSAEVWTQTVARMRGNGAQMTDADAESIAEYLATAKAGSKPLCR